jgi:hypothetical protein
MVTAEAAKPVLVHTHTQVQIQEKVVGCQVQ